MITWHVERANHTFERVKANSIHVNDAGALIFKPSHTNLPTTIYARGAWLSVVQEERKSL
jgi:hypothetical protein